MVADWAVVLATLVFALTVLSPMGRFVGVWVGSKDNIGSAWQRHYGRPALGLYVVGAFYFSLLAWWALFRGHPWLAVVAAALVVLQVLGGVLCIRGQRQGRTRSVM